MSQVPPVATAPPAQPDTGVVNIDESMAELTALRTVLLYTITAPFGLLPEERLWAGWHLGTILAPLVGRPSQMVPLAVRQELDARAYSNALDYEHESLTAPVHDPEAVHADIHDWVAVMMRMIGQCYALTPMEESAMQGQLTRLLRELGVGHPHNPRPARYLPNDVRLRLATNRDL